MSQLELAVNHAVNDYRASLLRQRFASNVTGGLDAKRSRAWKEFGYKENLTFDDFYKAYRRNGIAFGIIDKLITKCWSTDPKVYEGTEVEKDRDATPWERNVEGIFDAEETWQAFEEADRRRMVGGYSALLLRIRDSKDWNEAVEPGSYELVELIPVWAKNIKPKDIETDTDSDNYGKPKAWEYTELLNGDGNTRAVTIHPDRLFILGDWRSDNVPFLEPVFNNLVNIEKAEGGSGESLVKNSSRQMGLNFDPKINLASIAAMYGVSIDQLQERFNEAARDMNEGTDLLLITQGATATPLVADVPDPTPIYNINLQSTAAGVDIPTRIIVGNQQGERASTEDNDYMNARCQSRRVTRLTTDIKAFVRKLMDIGLIDRVPRFNIHWDDLAEASLSSKLANGKSMVEINETAANAGMSRPIYTPEQVLSVTGFEDMYAMEPDPLPDEDPEGEEADDGSR